MGINAEQLRDLVIRPTLISMGMWSDSAGELLIGTCAQESDMGTYLKQLDGGPAIGIYQMEPDTYYDCWSNYINYRPKIRNDILRLCGRDEKSNIPHTSEMISNLNLATAMARIKYWRVKEALPIADNIAGMAAYWKNHYNTLHGLGEVKEFVDNYNRYASRET